MPTLPTRTTRTTAPPTPAAEPSRPARPSPARTPSPVARRAAPPAVRLPPSRGGSEAVHVHTEGAAAEHAIRPTGLADFAGTAGPGEPLPQAVRPQLEETLGVSLEGVRVHTDTRAAAVASSLNARAFTYGTHIFLGPRERPTDLRLIAHEAAHVVQQQGAAPTPQPLTERGGDAYEREAERASAAAVGGEQFTVRERTRSPRVQRLGLSDILDGLAELAANVPGFTLLTVIIGRNPINMRRVERNFTNLLRGFMGLIPGGELLFQILNRYGVVERIGRWVSDEVSSLGLTFEYLRRRFTEFTDSLSWTDIFSPGDVWRRARNIFTEPVNRITAFISRLISQAVTWLKETFMQPLSEFARRIPGYTLVTVLLGRDPFTGAPVDRSPLNLVRAFAEFIPGGTEKVNQLVESRALQRAYEWFIQETRARNLTWDRVTGTFAQAWNSLRLEDVLHPIDTIGRVANIFRPLMGDLVGFAGAALMKLLELIFEAAMGAGGARVLAILKRAQSTFNLIIRDPVGFLRNLLGAVGQGVRQFMTNILRHLQQGVVAWLTGPVARAGIQMPERWDLRGIVWFVMQILGLTWDRVRQKLVRLLGERAVAVLEGGFQLIRDIRERGLVQALRERVTEFFGQLQEAALGGIRSFVQRQLVRAGIMQLLSLLNPVGAVIQAIVKTYTTIRFFIDRIRQILDLVESVLNSIAAIAAGSIGAAANLVERTMARTIPIILDFLARFIGLGDVGAHVQRTIRQLQERVDQMLDRAVEWIRTMAQRLVAAGQRGVRGVLRWLGIRKEFTTPTGHQHSLFFRGEGANARLMLASWPPGSVEARIEEAKAEDEANADKYDAALRKVEQIRQAIAAQNATATDTSAGAAANLVDQHMESLKNILRTCNLDARTPLSRVTFTLRGGLAGAVKAWPLTKFGGNTVGSQPGAGTIPQATAHYHSFDLVQDVQNPKRWYPREWRAGHILSSHLHGPGENSNLIPVREKDNGRMLRGWEQDMKTEIPNSTKTFYFDASVTYHTSNSNDNRYLVYFPETITVEWGRLSARRNNTFEKQGTPRYRDTLRFDPPPASRAEQQKTFNLRLTSRTRFRELKGRESLAISNDAIERIVSALENKHGMSTEQALRQFYRQQASSRDLSPLMVTRYSPPDEKSAADFATLRAVTRVLRGKDYTIVVDYDY